MNNVVSYFSKKYTIMHNFQKLEVWKASMELTTEIYNYTKNFPDNEVYGITSQMRRCSISIPSNIAEGSGRKTNKEFVHFLSIANGSSYELQTQIIVSNNIGYINEEVKDSLTTKLISVQKMIYTLIQKFS
jgi:four helix bundle protein